MHVIIIWDGNLLLSWISLISTPIGVKRVRGSSARIHMRWIWWRRHWGRHSTVPHSLIKQMRLVWRCPLFERWYNCTGYHLHALLGNWSSFFLFAQINLKTVSCFLTVHALKSFFKMSFCHLLNSRAAGLWGHFVTLIIYIGPIYNRTVFWYSSICPQLYVLMQCICKHTT